MVPVEPVLEVRDVVKHYETGRRLLGRRDTVAAVNGVSLAVNPGETLGLVGESGCGKSTLSRLLMGLEPPTSGRLYYAGEDITAASGERRRRLRRRIQLVMQDPYASLNPKMTVGEIVGEPFAIHRDVLERTARARRVEELLELVGLDPAHTRRYPHQFSGGQRQRIGIARALALNPEIIICDEPVSALDVSIQAQVLNLLADLQRRLGISFIFISHDLSVVRHLAHRVAVMYLGRIVESSPTAELFDHPRHPYTEALLAAAPVPDPSITSSGERRYIRKLTGDVASTDDQPSGCNFRSRCWWRQELELVGGSDVTLCERDSPRLTQHAAGHRAACHFSQDFSEINDGISLDLAERAARASTERKDR